MAGNRWCIGQLAANLRLARSSLKRLLSLRENQGEIHSQLPAGWADIRRFEVVAHPPLDGEREGTQLGDLAGEDVDRHGPCLAAVSFPVRDRLAVDAQSDRLLRSMSEEWLEVSLVYVGAVHVAGVGVRPELVRQDAVGPGSREFQDDERGADGPLPRSQRGVGGGRDPESRADAPYDLPLFRR